MTKKKKAKTLYAYAYRNGQIRFGFKVPDGALEVMSGTSKHVRNTISVRARESYPTERGGDDTVPLVPGVPEARYENEAVDALIQFSRWCRGDKIKKIHPPTKAQIARGYAVNRIEFEPTVK